MIVVVMGVTGVGKSTVGRRLARRLGWAFADGDDFHPASSIAKMRAGEPLSDVDRAPWLEALATRIEEWRAGGEDAVLACSALRRAYRERLSAGHDDLRFVYLTAPADVIEQRVRQRSDHFMPPSLLDSQYATLEPPAPDEAALTLDVRLPPDRIVERIVEWLAPEE